MAKSYRKSNLAKARIHQHNTMNTEGTDSQSDCGYEGEVECDPSSDDEQVDADEDWSDDESLAELERDELEASLSALCKEAESRDAPDAFEQMMSCKDSKEWMKVEANQALGYTKNSTCTQERRRKGA
jgi:hypothetical protein